MLLAQLRRDGRGGALIVCADVDRDAHCLMALALPRSSLTSSVSVTESMPDDIAVLSGSDSL